MILHILQSAWATITAHALFSVELILALAIFMSLFFFRRPKPVQAPVLKSQLQTDNKKKSTIVITSQDIRAIAGDDVLTTQLDLARAYMEIGKKKLAKKILEHVMTHGNISQKQMAQSLMMAL